MQHLRVCIISGAAMWSELWRQAFCGYTRKSNDTPALPLLSGAEVVHPADATPKVRPLKPDTGKLAVQHQCLLLSKQVHIYNVDPPPAIGLR